jgi:hypothetical protein
MPSMGKYCKAYPLPRLRAFSGWTENRDNARKTTQQIDGKDVEAPREWTDDDFLYLQENYVVTDGCFIDENIVFDAVTEEWTQFCHQQLQFEIPDYLRDDETADAAANAPSSQPANA